MCHTHPQQPLCTTRAPHTEPTNYFLQAPQQASPAPPAQQPIPLTALPSPLLSHHTTIHAHNALRRLHARHTHGRTRVCKHIHSVARQAADGGWLPEPSPPAPPLDGLSGEVLGLLPLLLPPLPSSPSSLPLLLLLPGDLRRSISSQLQASAQPHSGAPPFLSLFFLPSCGCCSC